MLHDVAASRFWCLDLKLLPWRFCEPCGRSLAPGGGRLARTGRGSGGRARCCSQRRHYPSAKFTPLVSMLAALPIGTWRGRQQNSDSAGMSEGAVGDRARQPPRPNAGLHAGRARGARKHRGPRQHVSATCRPACVANARCQHMSGNICVATCRPTRVAKRVAAELFPRCLLFLVSSVSTVSVFDLWPVALAPKATHDAAHAANPNEGSCWRNTC